MFFSFILYIYIFCCESADSEIHISQVPVFFYWRIFAKIQPEKCNFDQSKAFFMGKKWSKFAKFRKKYKIQIARFLQ